MKKILFLICMLFSGFVQAQQHVTFLTSDSLRKYSYAFEENWIYHPGDNPAWSAKDFNDSSWQLLDSRLRLQDSAQKKFSNKGWFRLHLLIDSSLSEMPLMIRIRHFGASEIYIDGKKIKEYGKIGKDANSTENENPKAIPLVIKSLTPGRHVIAVRYANYFAKQEWDGYSQIEAGFFINMYDANKFLDSYVPEMAMVSLGLLTLMGFFLALSLSHLFLWMYQRSGKANLYFSIFCFGVSMAFLLPYMGYLITDPSWSRTGTYLGIAVSIIITIALSGVTNSLFSTGRRRFRIISAICLLPAFVSLIDIKFAVLTIFITILVVTAESIVLTVRSMYRKEPGARIVGVGILFFTIFTFLLVAVAVISDGIRVESTEGSIILVSLCVSALLSIPISMSTYLAWHVARISKDLKLQLSQVQTLSDKTLAQEQEKQQYLETEKERLEEIVNIRTEEIRTEKSKSDDLLRNILPEEIANELKQKGSSEAKYFDHVTVIFTDFVNFTKAGERFTPQQLVDELHTCFKAFDDIISKYHIEKIKTIGDAYLAVSGLPAADDNHAEKTVRAALEIKQYMNDRKKLLGDKTFDIRIGLHSGAVVAGIVGVKKFAYDIWGDTVNTAARMEQSSLPDKINISQSTYNLVQGKFNCTYRGEIAAKNKGDMNMYFVDGVNEPT